MSEECRVPLDEERRKRRCLTLILIFATTFLGAAGSAQAAMYWGGTIKGDVYGMSSDAPGDPSVLAGFEGDVGKEITFINTGQQWVSFDTATMQASIDAGAIPLVTMGLAPGVTLAEVAAGNQDSQIRAWARQAKAWGHPFLFRPWWEVNGDWYSWGRDPNYVAAWEHFHDLVVEEGATNVTWAWIVNAIWWDPASDPTPFYPGDDYVDWVGMDAYNWGRNPLQPDRWLTPEQAIGPTLQGLDDIAPGKPVCICEDASTEIGGNKASWIRDLLNSYLPHHPEIKAFLWFNWNVEQNGGRWDWPVESSVPAEQAFRDGIQNSTYLASLPPLSPLAKVPMPTAPPAADPAPPVPDLTPAAGGSWSPALDPGSGTGDARNAVVAIGPGGEATLAWEHFDGSNYVIQERRVAPGGTTSGPIQDLSAPGEDAFGPQVAVDPHGTATVVWKRFDGSNFIVQERRINAAGFPEASAHDLSAPGQYAGQQQVAVATDGSAVVAWERYNGWKSVVQARKISPAGTLASGIYDLSDNAENAVEPQVGVVPDGSVIVAWDRYDGSDQIVQERRIDPAGSPGPEAHDLSAPGQSAIEPEVGLAPDGTATVVWIRSGGGDDVVQSRQVTSAGIPTGSVRDLSESGQPAIEPHLAVDQNGAALVVWERFDGSHFIVQERRIRPEGNPEALTYNLSAASNSAHEPQVAMGPEGTGAIVWDRFDGSNTVVQARRISSDGSPIGSPVDLSASGENAGIPAVAAGGNDIVIASWRRFNGANDRVEASAFGVPRARFEPSSHDFGSVPVGSGTDSSEFSIVNTGSAGLAISAVTVGGKDPGQFQLAGISSCTDSVLRPGATCTISAVFAPTAAGAHEASLRVVSNAASSPDFVRLSGVGAAPASSPDVTAPPGTGIQASNRFIFGRPRLNRAAGTATLPVTFFGPGTVKLAGYGVLVRVPPSRNRPSRFATKAIAAARTVMVRLTPTSTERKVLERRRTVKVAVQATFRPTEGATLRGSARLVLRRSGCRRQSSILSTPSASIPAKAGADYAAKPPPAQRRVWRVSC